MKLLKLKELIEEKIGQLMHELDRCKRFLQSKNTCL